MRGLAPFLSHTLAVSGCLLLCASVLPAIIGPPPILVENINPGSASSYVPYSPSGFWIDADPVALGRRWIFHATDGVSGLEPWISDGTEAGTYIIKDICSGSNGSFPESGDLTWFAQRMVRFGDAVYFVANDCSHGWEVWKTDGTESGTEMLKDIGGGCLGGPSDLKVLDGWLYFLADDCVNGEEVWRSNGTEAGTVRMPFLPTVRFDDYVAYNGDLYFPGNDGSHGWEPWKSDLTAGGTGMFVDVNPGWEDSLLQQLIVFDGKLFFDADDGTHDNELWVSDGTVAGTHIFKDLGSGGSFIWSLTVAGDKLFFSCDIDDGVELCVTDGTPAGTMMVKDINPGWDASIPAWLTPVGNYLFFTAETASEGRELWFSDGTPAGTRMIKRIYPGNDTFDPSPQLLTTVNGMLFFRADDGVHGSELWRSDGSEAGTFMVADIAPAGNHSTPAWLTEVGGSLFFCAWNNTLGREPYMLQVSEPLLVQLDSPGSTGVSSQEFEPAQALFDSFAADDFAVPAGTAPWDVGIVHAPGLYFNGTGPALLANLEIHQDNGGMPGASVCSYDGLSGSSFLQSDGDFTLILPEPCTLQAGNYWAMVQADLDASAAQWVWLERSAQNGQPYVWKNPGDGFGSGCTTWTYGNVCTPGSDPDLLLALYGPPGCDKPWHVELSAHTVSGPEIHEACRQISVGPGLIVAGSGNLRLEAPITVLEEGTTVEANGTLTVSGRD